MGLIGSPVPIASCPTKGVDLVEAELEAAAERPPRRGGGGGSVAEDDIR